MKVIGRLLIAMVAAAILIWVAPRANPLLGFPLFLFSAAFLAWAITPLFTRFLADTVVDFIFSVHETTAPTDPNDPYLVDQSQKVFSLMRTVSFLTLAAALYGFFWSTPILLTWPAIDTLLTMSTGV